MSDDEFDGVYLAEIQRLSHRHWTPVHVAQRAAQLLVLDHTTRVLDVGSGPGKFCIIGALTSTGKFTGVEQRRYLVEEARRVCQGYGVPGVAMIHGNMADIDWGQFDAFYLYNPFYENVVPRAAPDQTIPCGGELYSMYVDVVQKKLAALPDGTRVVTYHGFGGKFPGDYVKQCSERIGNDSLNLWVKTAGDAGF